VMAKKAKPAKKKAAAPKKPAPKTKAKAAKPVAKSPVARRPKAAKHLVRPVAGKKPAADARPAKTAPKPVAKATARLPAKPVKPVKPVKVKMTAAQAAAFRGFKKAVFEKLGELRQELIDEIHALSDSSLVFDRNPGEELADIGSENFLREMELGMMTEEEKRLVLVESALRRLKDNNFGFCADCAGKIQEGRLLALPYARLCMKCKAKREAEEAEGIAAQPESIQLTE